MIRDIRNPPSANEATNRAARFALVGYVTGALEETGKYKLSEDYFRCVFADDVAPINNHGPSGCTARTEFTRVCHLIEMRLAWDLHSRIRLAIRQYRSQESYSYFYSKPRAIAYEYEYRRRLITSRINTMSNRPGQKPVNGYNFINPQEEIAKGLRTCLLFAAI